MSRLDQAERQPSDLFEHVFRNAGVLLLGHRLHGPAANIENGHLGRGCMEGEMSAGTVKPKSTYLERRKLYLRMSERLSADEGRVVCEYMVWCFGFALNGV